MGAFWDSVGSCSSFKRAAPSIAQAGCEINGLCVDDNSFEFLFWKIERNRAKAKFLGGPEANPPFVLEKAIIGKTQRRSTDGIVAHFQHREFRNIENMITQDRIEKTRQHT